MWKWIHRKWQILKCAVCDRDITTVVILKGKNRKRYTVGSMCASHILGDD